MFGQDIGTLNVTIEVIHVLSHRGYLKYVKMIILHARVKINHVVKTVKYSFNSFFCLSHFAVICSLYDFTLDYFVNSEASVSLDA